jgi:hypothetical protein
MGTHKRTFSDAHIGRIPTRYSHLVAIGRTSRVRFKAHRAQRMTSLSKGAPLKPATGPLGGI